jgi:ComF family protein
VVAPFVYGGPVAVAIHRLKYRGAREVAGRLACHLLDAGESLLEEADVVAPIPLHPNRRRGRGFDQALLLAREVHRRAGTPLARSLLRRKTEGLHQVGKGKEERSQNIQGAFAARSARGLSVVLVDDVVTTGATAAAATAALLAEGAHEVRILTLARAL